MFQIVPILTDIIFCPQNHTFIFFAVTNIEMSFMVKKLFRLRLELCPGLPIRRLREIFIVLLTTKYLEKFNGNHTYNLENPIVTSTFSSYSVVVKLKGRCLFSKVELSSNLIRKRADQLILTDLIFFPQNQTFIFFAITNLNPYLNRNEMWPI